MKITDETKEFTDSSLFGTATLEVSSNHSGTHERPGVYLRTENRVAGHTEYTAYGTDNVEEVKEIIRHMAKMAGLSVTIHSVPWYQTFEVGDIVKVKADYGPFNRRVGTVVEPTTHSDRWPYRVQFDKDDAGNPEFEIFSPKELEKVATDAEIN